MTAADWDIIIRDGAMVMTTIIVPFGIWAYQKRTGVQVNDQERAAVQSALTTAAGIVQTQLDQGALKVADITPEHPVIMKAAREALARVPDAAAAQATTPAAAAAVIVARVDTTPKPALVMLPPLSVPPAPSIPRA